LKDDETIVISGGSSGTVIRKCRPNWSLQGRAACFEYYLDRLLLMMLADCAVWYQRFVEEFGESKSLGELDKLAHQAVLEVIRRIFQEFDGEKWCEIYPDDWNKLRLAEKVASTQASIAVRLLMLVKEMLEEVLSREAPPITKFVITGGLSKSEFFQEMFSVGLPLLVKDCQVFVSDRKGPLANKSAVLGAMINAMVGVGDFPDLASAIDVHCPLKPAPCPSQERRSMLGDFIKRNLL